MTTATSSTLGFDTEHPSDLDEIHEGLSREPKRLPCKLFYDAHGSRLFEHITRLPEYYPTRTELGLLERYAREVSESLGPGVVLVEFGSGASQKTRLLLDALCSPRAYVPIDISTEMLMSSARALGRRYPELDVRPVPGDYLEDLDLPLSERERSGRVLAFFPGSTIGNFEPDDAVAFLGRVRRSCGSQAELLIGVDLPKTKAVLEAAYDDAAGVTALFNLNALRVLNRDYGAQFRLDDFRHRALWNERASRVEMHLVSQREQEVLVGDESFWFRAGEPIVTEHCYKYEPDEFRRLAERAGFEVAQVWIDERRLFSLQRLAPARGEPR